jgi:hypothetical protein
MFIQNLKPMKKLLLIFVFSACRLLNAQIPTHWEPRGVGGGGGLFSPSINPENMQEFYVACYMGELFHTTDFGLSYQTVDFRKIQASTSSKVWFTSQPGLLYCVNYSSGVFLPAKSSDSGDTWHTLTGLDPWEWVCNLHVDYLNPQILVANFWEEIIISTTWGESFNTIHQTGIGEGAHFAGVFFDFPDIYVGLNEGLLISHDGGQNFAFETIPGIADGQAFYSLAGSRQIDTVRLMGTTIHIQDFWNSMPASECWETVDFIYRLDYGLSEWENIGQTINWRIDYPMLISMAENNIHTAYIGSGDAGSFPILLKTSDGGDNWQHAFVTYNNQNIHSGWMGYLGDKNCWYPGVVLGMDVAKFNAGVVIFSDLMSVHKTSDGGNTWYQAYTAPEYQHPPAARRRNFRITKASASKTQAYGAWCGRMKKISSPAFLTSAESEAKMAATTGVKS